MANELFRWEDGERDEWGIDISELTIKCRCNRCGIVWDEQLYAEDMYYYKPNDDGTFYCHPTDGLCNQCFLGISSYALRDTEAHGETEPQP